MNISDYKKQKKVKKWIIIIIAFIIVFSSIAYIGFKVVLYPIDKIYVMAYDTTNDKIKGNVNIESFLERSEYFDIGANSYGYAVFKEPNTAFAVFVELYSDGIELVQKEFNLGPLTETNYDGYKQCAFLMAGDSEAEKQARFIPEFLDIYENSFTLS